MQRSVASLFSVGDYVPRSSVLDAYSNSNGTFIIVSPESESYTGQNQTTTSYVVCLYSTSLLLFLIIIFGQEFDTDINYKPVIRHNVARVV
jgi:hypothetical protein